MGIRENLGGGGLVAGGAFGVDSALPKTQGGQNLDLIPGVSGGTSLGLGVTFTGLGAASYISDMGGSKNLGIIFMFVGISLIAFDIFRKISYSESI